MRGFHHEAGNLGLEISDWEEAIQSPIASPESQIPSTVK
jgi:hypothetical protein